jgi:hypothetical protein
MGGGKSGWVHEGKNLPLAEASSGKTGKLERSISGPWKNPKAPISGITPSY